MEKTVPYEGLKRFLVELLGLLTLIPLAPLINRYLPPIMAGDWNMDLVVALIIAIVLVRLMIWLFKPLIVPAFALIMGILLFNLFTHGYSFKNVVYDYKGLVMGNWITKDEKQPDLLSFRPSLFLDSRSRLANTIRNKANYQDSVVRNFAVEHSLQYFTEYYPKYRGIVRQLSLFKYINNNFNYVSDSERDEYYATPRETILNGMGGDCDDHSILMGACMEAIGARIRLVIVKNHMYPELYVGDKKEFALLQKAIQQLFAEEHIRQFNYHESNGVYWINLDYTARYPGGRYMNNDVYMVIQL